MKTAQEIRAEFLSFFKEQGHEIVSSAPVVPQGDPTLLFTNAGMNQFKDVFLGTGTRPFTRAADTQKCVRVSGKHNDLEEVGVDTYHHTFFEMLGNWSFGDYFKAEAITWAWELLVNRWGLDPEKIYVTVFAGDEADGLEPDTESEELWPKLTGIAKERVLRFDKKDNFWEMGEVGPCGPCTEIHYDRGPEADDTDGSKSWVNSDSARYIEIWNLVFIEFNRAEDGKLTPLPSKHVDTGMGFERIVSLLQGKISNYDTDLFAPIFSGLAEVTGVTHDSSDSKEAIALRVIADHVRTLCVAFADGALPSNEGRGYVLRRILRRASRFGRQSLGQEKPFIHAIVPAVVEALGEAFPEIKQRQDHIALLIESEEKAFAQTLDRGLTLYSELAAKVKASGAKAIRGEEAYDLYATFGFPRDLVELMAREDDLEVESKGWDSAQAEHREASKASGRFGFEINPAEFEGLPKTETLFYRDDEGATEGGTRASARPLKLVAGTHLVLDRSPFYAESGGQMGDQGVVEGEGFRFRVTDTRKNGDVVTHIGELEQGSADALPAEVNAQVDLGRRHGLMANHTGTHLLHWALREVLGDHATQQGSLVAADRLRFDVTHPRAISLEDIETIERMVNERIAEDAPLTTSVEDLEDAKERGVTALFGEKYDQKVRVVDIGGFSTELCGGTHCERSGQIGAFVIVSESAVQAGVRRIEAVTGAAAIQRLQRDRRLLRDAAAALKSKVEELPARIEGLQLQVKELRKSGGQQKAQDAGALAKSLRESAQLVGETRVIVASAEAGAKELAAIADVIRNDPGEVCGLIASAEGDKVALVSFASKSVAGKRYHAGNWAREAAKRLGGGGGGRPDFAQAGGKDVAQLPSVLDALRTEILASLG